MIKKEAYAALYALQNLHYYMVGAEFMIKTDPKLLKYFFGADWTNKKIWTQAL